MSLITDTTPINQPEGTYRFALNVIFSTDENATTAISSEPGRSNVHIFPSGYKVIGSIYFDNKVLVFATDNQTSEIGILEKRSYRTIYNGDLNFSKDHPILGEHRILAGCDDVFYFMDGINPDRYFNLSNIPSTPGEFSIIRNATEPNIDVAINNTGGRMPSSSVSFQLQYINLQGDVFDVSEPTVGLPVYNDTISSTAQGSTETTNKSATLNITNIDTRFPYVRLIAIHNVEGNYEVYQIDNIISTNESLEIIYPGPTENDIRIDNREVQVGKSIYNTSLVSEQVLGRLLRANVQEITQDYSNHQRLVNQIETNAVQVAVDKNNFSQDPEFYKNNMTFQSDEVYAIGIRFTDSTNLLPATPIYHVPGRAALPTELDEVTYNDETYFRFQIENTADLGPDTNTMGYYQSTSNYPDITDCNGEFIYGDLAGTPVRHHKMPSRRNIPLDIGNEIFLIHLNFSNITYPDGYDGYEMFYVERTDNNSTVVDSGYLNFSNIQRFPDQANSPIRDVVGSIGSAFNNSSIGNFISPKALTESLVRGTHFDVQKSYVRDTTTRETENEVDLGTLISDRLRLINNINNYYFFDRQVIIQPNSMSRDFDQDVVNTSYSNVANIFNVTHDLTHQGQTYYSVLKRVLSPYDNVQSLVYKPLVKVGDNWQGDTFITKFHAFTISNEINQAFYLRDSYVESNLNFALLDGERFSEDQGISYLRNIDIEQSNEWLPENYQENLAFRYRSIKSYFPLPITYDYCDRCRSANPTRIIYSPQSFQEELSDSYLINNVNDFIDLPADTGPIMGMKYKNNRLYVHTTQTTYVLTPNPQYLTTNNEVAQLQTGDFLSIPAQEIIDSDYGFGGLQSKTGTVDTEYGYFWVDGLKGSLNMIQNQFKSVSNEGMISWFRNFTFEDSDVVMGYDPYYSRVLMRVRNSDPCRPYHTLSYSLLKRGFASFHSYNPDFFMADATNMYSSYGNLIKFHEENRFYNQHPVVVEQIDLKMQTSNLISLVHYTEFFEDNQEVEDVFSELIVYNNNQSTGPLTLFKSGPYGTISYDPSTRPVVITDKNHAISNLYDNSTDTTVTAIPCNPAVYTDREFVNTDVSAFRYDSPIFKEKFTIARLTYKPERDRRMTHYLLQQNKQQSIR